MNLREIKYREFKIPEINLEVYKYVRIEIGTSHNIEKEKIFKTIYNVYSNLNIKTIDGGLILLLWIKRIKIKSKTVEEYLKSNGVSYTGVNTFFEYTSQANENIGKETHIGDLNEQQRRVVEIFILTNSHSQILINTVGMYYSILLLTYLIIRSYIKEGGKCIEVTYPHFKKDDELCYFVANEAKIIRLGEMRGV